MCEPCGGSGMQRGALHLATSTGRVCSKHQHELFQVLRSTASHRHFDCTMQKLNGTLAFPAKHPKPWLQLPALRFLGPLRRPNDFRQQGEGRVPGSPGSQFGSPTTPRQIFPPKLPQPSLAPAHCAATASLLRPSWVAAWRQAIPATSPDAVCCAPFPV